MSMLKGDTHAHHSVEMAGNASAEQDRGQNGPQALSLWHAMASDRGFVSGPAWRTPHALVPRVPARRPLVTDNRGSLERINRTISLASHLLASASRLDPQWNLSRRLGPIAEHAAAVTRYLLGRSDLRWLVCTGQTRGDDVGRCHRGNGTRILMLTDGRGAPLSADTTAAQHNEASTIETPIDQCLPHRKLQRWFYDKTANANWLRASLHVRGIELTCPHCKIRTRPPVKDGRSLRCDKRHYRIERSFRWLQNCRQRITRWEYYSELFKGFVHLNYLYTILKGL